jgi:hypothetical protein
MKGQSYYSPESDRAIPVSCICTFPILYPASHHLELALAVYFVSEEMNPGSVENETVKQKNGQTDEPAKSFRASTPVQKCTTNSYSSTPHQPTCHSRLRPVTRTPTGPVLPRVNQATQLY